MKDIRVEHVYKRYRDELILEDFSLKIPSGQFFALLGPSGCGKTTLLRLIGGFQSVDAGSIYLGGVDITNLPINKRRIHTVFQNYALFPHLNVFDNVAYSQRLQHIPEKTIEEKVIAILNVVHLGNHIYKPIDQLSGGQRQRVALARAIINEPDVLLLDEPLAALDLKLREKMLIELIDLQSKLKTTFVYVTHDQFEALTVADQMAIMNHNGELEQIGSPKQIYEFPVSSFVANFVGTTNILQGELLLTDTQSEVALHGLGVFQVFIPARKSWMVDKARVYMSIRPEKILISKREVSGFSNHMSGVVESIVYHGRSTQYNVRLANSFLLQVFEQNEEHFEREIIDYDDQVHLYWQKENALLLEK